MNQEKKEKRSLSGHALDCFEFYKHGNCVHNLPEMTPPQEKEEKKCEIIKCEHQGAGSEGLTISYDSSEKECCAECSMPASGAPDETQKECINSKCKYCHDSSDWEKEEIKKRKAFYDFFDKIYIDEKCTNPDSVKMQQSATYWLNLIQKEKDETAIWWSRQARTETIKAVEDMLHKNTRFDGYVYTQRIIDLITKLKENK